MKSKFDKFKCPHANSPVPQARFGTHYDASWSVLPVSGVLALFSLDKLKVQNIARPSELYTSYVLPLSGHMTIDSMVLGFVCLV